MAIGRYPIPPPEPKELAAIFGPKYSASADQSESPSPSSKNRPSMNLLVKLTNFYWFFKIHFYYIFTVLLNFTGSFYLPYGDGPRLMSIFELLDYIVNEVNELFILVTILYALISKIKLVN